MMMMMARLSVIVRLLTIISFCLSTLDARLTPPLPAPPTTVHRSPPQLLRNKSSTPVNDDLRDTVSDGQFILPTTNKSSK